MIENICLGKRQNPAFGFKNTITSKCGQFKGIGGLLQTAVCNGWKVTTFWVYCKRKIPGPYGKKSLTRQNGLPHDVVSPLSL